MRDSEEVPKVLPPSLVRDILKSKDVNAP